MEATKEIARRRPGQLSVSPPCRHEELAPEVDDHEEEEGLDTPQVKGVHEVSRVPTHATNSAP